MSSSSEIFALLSSTEIDSKYDELQLLIDSDCFVLQSTDKYGRLPIHVACENPHDTLRIVQLLLNGPESISQPNRHGRRHGDLPIHYLCENNNLDEALSVDILTLLLEAFPESVQRENSQDELPIHTAARWSMTPKILKILVDAYPQSVRIPGVDGMLPIHLACDSDNCRLDSVEYLLDIYPESINIRDNEGWLPIHYAASSNGSQKADVIEHLLMKDPKCASNMKTGTEHYPLHYACYSRNGNLLAVQLLFNAYPEAIFEAVGEYTPLDLAREKSHAAIINFLEAQLVYAEKSQDTNAMTTLDKNGRAILHRALKDNASLGSIKLLVKGSAVLRMADYSMAFPLHIACD